MPYKWCEGVKQQAVEYILNADDGVALHYVYEEIYRIVSSRPDARVYDVSMAEGKLIETEIIPEYLG